MEQVKEDALAMVFASDAGADMSYGVTSPYVITIHFQVRHIWRTSWSVLLASSNPGVSTRTSLLPIREDWLAALSILGTEHDR
jgi:hypothetical protein